MNTPGTTDDGGMHPGAAAEVGAAQIAARSIAILEANWRKTHTVPAGGLYPHQWSWDSAFIAIGLSRMSPRRAGQEMDALFAGQWDDGRLPQIIFDPYRDKDYAPGASFWQSSRIPGAPRHVETAGLVQPPNHAWAVWKIHQADPAESRRRSFLERNYSKLVHWHEYLSTRRDRGGSGLACIVHPWESGTDNSPLWDTVMKRVPGNCKTVLNRPDLQHADAGERPSQKEYGKYFWMAERYRDHNCDDADPDYPFLMEDPLFNTLLAVSELALAEIAGELGLSAGPHLERAREISAALEALYVPDLGCYSARDVTDGTMVHKATVNGLIPLLLTDLPHADALLETLYGPRFMGNDALMVPSYDATAEDHNPALYWRGPAWFNMSWMVSVALEQQGHSEKAAFLRNNIARLAAEQDFPEYVDPWTGAAHGTRSFSWTAALALETTYHGSPS
ncbi:hypothetical protein ACFWIX_05275 [Pseudarthrobacter sp. NPDC058362]|uniref:MGH1-like glycoside hydrolase domain-containing protein n=1 Tax=Pseudarthrobacter sp. NPDC058362 TaxID=3346458 RepID=UPI00364A6C99